MAVPAGLGNRPQPPWSGEPQLQPQHSCALGVALPWQVTEAREELPLDRRLPRYVRRLLRHGLVRRPEERDLELAEVRDMLLLTRRMEEEAELERRIVEVPPARVQHLSRSAIQADVTR